MTPAIAPLKAPQPATVSFRDRLRAGNVKRAADNKAVVQVPMELSACGNFFVVRIPRNMSYSDLRTKDAFTDESGKYHKESAMVTVNTQAVKDQSYGMSFTDAENNVRLDMAVRPYCTLNITCDYGTVALFDAESGEAKAIPA